MLFFLFLSLLLLNSNTLDMNTFMVNLLLNVNNKIKNSP